MRQNDPALRPGLASLALAVLLCLALPAGAASAATTDAKKHEPTVQTPAPAEPTPPASPGPKIAVIIPTVEAVGSSIDNQTLRAIFSGDLASHADELATLRAGSISIPELTVTYDVPGSDGKTATGRAVYRDIKVSNVTAGVAQSVSLGGIDVTTSDGGSAKFGKLSTGVFDIGALLRLYGLAPGSPVGDPKTIYENLAFEGGTVTTPKLSCTIGPMSVASFKARPLKVSFAELMAAAETAQAEGQNPSPETIAKFVGFYTDLPDAFEASPVRLSGFDCSGTDETTGKPVAFSLGTVTIGAFAHGIYPAINADNLKVTVGKDGQIGVGSFLVKSFDFSGPLAALKGAGSAVDAAWFEDHYRELIPAFEGWSLSDLKVDMPDDQNPGERIRASAAAFDLSLKNYRNGVPTDISTSASHIAVVLPGKTSDESIQKLLDMGIDKIDIGYELALNWDQPSQQIKLGKLSVTGADMGSIAVAAVIGKATEDLFSNDTNVALAAAMGLTVKSVNIDVKDAGLADLLLRRAAAEQGKNIAEFRTALSGVAQGTILMMLGGSPDAAKLSSAVGAFIGGAKSLTIAIAAKDPAGLSTDDLQALQADPTALAGKVTIDATAK